MMNHELINQYGDPVWCANRRMEDLQNMDKVEPHDVDGLNNLFIMTKLLLLRLQGV